MSSYNPGTPLPLEIPADSQDQFLDNFQFINNIFGVNHIPFGNTIVNATRGNPTIITSPNHRLATGDNITVYTMDGLDPETGRQPWSINGTPYNVTVPGIIGDPTTFSIPVDTTNEPPYIANTGDFTVNLTVDPNGYGYGLHKLINFSGSRIPPGRNAPIASLFNQTITRKQPNQIDFTALQLLFENNPAALFQLTDMGSYRREDRGIGTAPFTSNVQQTSFRTPWGITINMGSIGVLAPAVQPPLITYLIPYTTTNFFTIATLDQTAATIKTGNGVRITTSGLTTFQTNFDTNKSTTTAWRVQFISMGQ